MSSSMLVLGIILILIKSIFYYIYFKELLNRLRDQEETSKRLKREMRHQAEEQKVARHNAQVQADEQRLREVQLQSGFPIIEK